jgi:hypothetical protein
VRTRRHRIRRRHAVIEHDHDTIGIAHLQNLAPIRRHEIVVEENRRIDFNRDDVTRSHDGAPAFARENLLRDRHSHGRLLNEIANGMPFRGGREQRTR